MIINHARNLLDELDKSHCDQSLRIVLPLPDEDEARLELLKEINSLGAKGYLQQGAAGIEFVVTDYTYDGF